MHLQIRSMVASGTGGPGAMSATEGAEGISVVQPGRLLHLLDLLARDERGIAGGDGHGPFSLRAASGSGIETTGTFVFSVTAPREEEEEAEHDKALARIKNDFPRSHKVVRQHQDLPHEAGALRNYVAMFANSGHLIDEIVIGVAECPPGGSGVITVPVQVHALRAVDR